MKNLLIGIWAAFSAFGKGCIVQNSLKVRGLLVGFLIGLLATSWTFFSLYSGPEWFLPVLTLPTYIFNVIWVAIENSRSGGADNLIPITFVATPFVYSLIGFGIGYIIDRKHKIYRKLPETKLDKNR